MNASHLGTLLWACLQWFWIEREIREMLPLLKGGTWRCVVLEIGQHVPLAWREPAKINKLLLADLCCNRLKQSYEISVFQQKLPTYKNQKYL